MILTSSSSRIFILVILLFLSSCGFKAVYSSNDNNKTYKFLQKIYIVPINSIEGAEFYNRLKNIIPSSSEESDYILESNIIFLQNFSILLKNSDIIREVLSVKVSYTLKEKNSGKLITNDNFTRISSYSTNFSPYNNLLQKQITQKNLAISSAEEMRNRLILYIEKNQNEISYK